VPDWLGNFQNPELALHFAEYAKAVARRYPWVRYFTPVNEIYVTARISAEDGLWNEQLTSDKGFVTALKASGRLQHHGGTCHHRSYPPGGAHPMRERLVCA
jgi:beta-glucosidase/6-phospho-beta-glucosidase/beta-galactosidase